MRKSNLQKSQELEFVINEYDLTKLKQSTHPNVYTTSQVNLYRFSTKVALHNTIPNPPKDLPEKNTA